MPAGDAGRTCGHCGATNNTDAKTCAECGAEVEAAAAAPTARSADDNPALRYVDPENRTEVTRFERWDDAELACGMLRSNGIACEVSSMVIPGLPSDLILWVNNPDAELAWALIADAEREASQKRTSAA